MFDIAKFDADEYDAAVLENTEWMFSDAEEIGSSDVSICARRISEDMKWDFDSLEQWVIQLIRGSVQDALRSTKGF